MAINASDVARMIDHSLLHPTMTDSDLTAGCELARSYECASVCIKPYGIKLAKDILQDSPVAVGTVIGFPHVKGRAIPHPRAIDIPHSKQGCAGEGTIPAG
jgi:deoxyribose-phosphate aldolase